MKIKFKMVLAEFDVQREAIKMIEVFFVRNLDGVFKPTI